jgi:hypothetical protein
VLNDGTVKFVDTATQLIDDVFADDPAFAAFGGQRLNPGNISIVRTIVTPGVTVNNKTGVVFPPTPPADCGRAVPLNCDTAVFLGLRSEYDVTTMANGTVLVHDNVRPLGATGSDGTDTLRNIERLQFADVTIPVPALVVRVLVPNVVGLSTADATAAIVAANLTLGTVGSVFSSTIAIDGVVNQNPVAGTRLDVGSRVGIDTSVGVGVPNVLGLTQAQATAAITSANVVVGAVTSAPSTTAAIGTVISQDPAFLTNGVLIGSSVALVLSSGTTVPNVVGQTQAAATAAITAAGLAVGAITSEKSNTVAFGSVISQTPVGGPPRVDPGSAVALVISLGSDAAPIAGATVRVTTQGAAQLRTPVLNTVPNTLLVALIAGDANPAGPNTFVTGITNTGVPLAWTKAAGTTATSPLGMAEVWWAYSTSAQSTNVTAALSSSKASMMTVTAFTGAATSLVGAASIVASGPPGAPSATIVTTRPNSLVYGVGVDYSNGRTMVAGAGQTKFAAQFVPAVNDTYWVQSRNAPIAAAGSPATINDTYGAVTDLWNLVVIEIRHP